MGGAGYGRWGGVGQVWKGGGAVGGTFNQSARYLSGQYLKCWPYTKHQDSLTGRSVPPSFLFPIKIDRADKYVFLNFVGFSLSFVLFFNFLNGTAHRLKMVRQRHFGYSDSKYL